MFKFRSRAGSVPPRASLQQINHADIGQSWEECQQHSPLTPCVKALQWNSDPLILLTSTSRQPRSNGDFMDGVSLYRDCGPDWAALGARCVVWYKVGQLLKMERALRCFPQVQALICQLNVTQGEGGH